MFASACTPFTLFYTDDTCKTWTPAFAADSLEYAFGSRGWGGGSSRVLANQAGWIALQSGEITPNLSAAVISYNGGSFFETAFDPFILNQLTGQFRNVTALALSDHYLYVGLEQFLVRTNQTTSGMNQLVLNIDTLPGIVPGSWISWIATSNNPSGFPMYFVVREPSQKTRLYKYYGDMLFELAGLPTNQVFTNVFTHPVKPLGDTIFVSSIDTINQDISVHRSFFGGFGFTDITPPFTVNSYLSDVDYSPDWNFVLDGIRLFFAGGPVSDNLGDTWQSSWPGLQEYGIATHPLNENLIIGSYITGTVTSNSGINGPFTKNNNIGFASVNVVDFDESQGDLYVATQSGLAYTSEYFNPLITGYEQWISPNGHFPVPNVGLEAGVSCVAIDPANSEHVVCGNQDGFFVTFSGAGDFALVTPPNWNNGIHFDNMVTDIIFVTSYNILAVTGHKFDPLPSLPPQTIGNIWQSMDGGSNWNIVTPIFPDEFEMGNCLVVGNAGGQTLIYAGTGFDDGNQYIPGALWSSSDYGDTWNKVNDAPAFGGSNPLPVYDIDIDPTNNELIYLSAGNVLARSFNGGLSFFITDIPYNLGAFTSSLIDPQYTDSITITVGRNVFKYNYQIDDADLKFKGLPGEFITSS
ncbi:MAG: hypothetical protein K8S16_14100, partial [Bacteroidales bacterium]|nr:hypothetical protein [Bacteroidales bacterium]